MEVESPDAMEHLEDPAWNKSPQTFPSMFAPTDTSIAKFLAGIPKYHSTLGEITVQDELELFFKGDIFRNKMKETVVYQEVPVPKRDVFNRRHPMFVRIHPDFDQKLEGSKYQNAMTLVSIAIEKYQWNIMVSGKLYDLYDSSFSRNLLLLV